MTLMVQKISRCYDTARNWWAGMSDSQQNAGLAITGFTGICLLTGGAIAQFAIAAVLTNVCFWYLVKDSPKTMEFTRRHGRKIDIAVTIAAVFGSGGTLGGFLLGLFFASVATFFRVMLAPPYTEAELAAQEAAKVKGDTNV
jgi:hypothetical protein